jgi:hypothetical protein
MKEVNRLGTDAVVICNSDGEDYQWDSIDDSFNKNDTTYTFDVYEMLGGGAFTRAETAPSCANDQGFLARGTARDSVMEYPDYKDMKDFA